MQIALRSNDACALPSNLTPSSYCYLNRIEPNSFAKQLVSDNSDMYNLKYVTEGNPPEADFKILYDGTVLAFADSESLRYLLIDKVSQLSEPDLSL